MTGILLALLLAVGTAACSSNDDGGAAGAGATAGAGGAPGAGGTPITGGAPGAGGAPSAGGAAGSDAAATPARVMVVGTFFTKITIGVAPPDLNGTATISKDNTTFSGDLLTYAPGTRVTFSVISNVETLPVVFRSKDATGNDISGNPLTITATVPDMLTVDVQHP